MELRDEPFINHPLPRVMVHTSRTLMLSELTALLASQVGGADLSDYRHAVLEDNVLLKETFAGRQKTFANLRQLYGLEATHPLFPVLRVLWQQSPKGRPLLALLAACSVDEILRATTPVILGKKENDKVVHVEMARKIAETFPERFNSMTLEAMGQRAAASWVQSGHLKGKVNKVRSRAQATPETMAFALFISTLQGERGYKLFDTLAVELQDASATELDALALAGAQHGYYKYRRLGDVLEVDFSGFLAKVGVGLV